MDMTGARRGFLGALLAAATGAPPAPVAARGVPSSSRVVDGVAIHFGVMPAEMVQGHPKRHPEAQMHGGPPAGGRHRDHVVVALFDSATGKRVENAEVTAGVMEIGSAGRSKKLEPMQIAGTVTYGSYFDFASGDGYHLIVRIHIPGRERPIEAEFEHRHFGQ